MGHGQSLRIECRIPGADCNPYLAYAAILASGLDGITNEIEPPPHFSGDIYQAAEIPRVPHSLAAPPTGSPSGCAGQLRAAVQEHYTHFFQKEIEAFDNSVTDWERWRYFERI